MNVFLHISLFSYKGFPCGSADKGSACNARDLGSIPRLGRFPGEGKGYPLQHSGLENYTDCIVYGVAKNWTQLSDFHFSRAGKGKETAAPLEYSKGTQSSQHFDYMTSDFQSSETANLFCF